jgi:hypothetical protein
MLNQRSRQLRLANTRLAGKQYYLAFTIYCLYQHRRSKSSSS